MRARRSKTHNKEDDYIYNFDGRSKYKNAFYEQGVNLFQVIFFVWPTAILQFCEFWTIGFTPSVMAYNYTSLALMFGFHSLCCSHYDQVVFFYMNLLFSLISFVQYGFFVNEWNRSDNNVFFDGVIYYSRLSGSAPGYTVKVNTTTVSYSEHQGALLSWWNFQIGWVSVLQLVACFHFIADIVILYNHPGKERARVQQRKKIEDAKKENKKKEKEYYRDEEKGEEEQELIIVTPDNENGKEQKVIDDVLKMRYIRENDFIEYRADIGDQFVLRVCITALGVITMLFCVLLLCLSFVLLIQNVMPFYQLIYSGNFLLWYMGTVCIMLPQGNSNYSCFTSGKYEKCRDKVLELRKKLVMESNQKNLLESWSEQKITDFFGNLPKEYSVILGAFYEMPPIINPGLKQKRECDTLVFGRKSETKKAVMWIYIITAFVAFFFSIWVAISQVIWSNEQSNNTIGWLCDPSFKTAISTNKTYTYNTNYTVQLLPTNGTAISNPTLYWYTVWGCADFVFNWFFVFLSCILLVLISFYGAIFLRAERQFFKESKSKVFQEGRMMDCYFLELIDNFRVNARQYNDLGICGSVLDKLSPRKVKIVDT